MCGITGLFGENICNSHSKDTLENMLEVAERRGPEGKTTKQVKGGLVGHTLLAFVEKGNNPQPLIENDSIIVYNGEIYNWQDLNSNYDLGANNDTETLLRGIRKYGSEFLSQIDGQFAFIAQIPDGDGNIETVVGRDKYGISPLTFGHTPNGELAIASTDQALSAAGVKKQKTVPAGSYGKVRENDLDLEYWFELQNVDQKDKEAVDPKDILEKAKQSAIARIPDERNKLYIAMGGIDSQFNTATIARHTLGDFGGAITVVPWDPEDPDNNTLGDYHEAKATAEMLEKEGISITHHVVQLTPEYIDNALDRILDVLGPDYMNLSCGLAEDLVATTVKELGGNTIITAGGPDEAGWSYKLWTLDNKENLEEGFYAVNDQFSTAEGVRAGLVFGEHGLENRVPLAFLIEESMKIPSYQKQNIRDWGDGSDPTAIKMDDKIFWRQALKGVLPEKSLNKPKETIHSASGAKQALYHVGLNDDAYQSQRRDFVKQAKDLGWQGFFFGDLENLDPKNIITEGQLYSLWRWSKLKPEQFREGSEARYGIDMAGAPRYSKSLNDKISKPLCFDWQKI